MYVSLYLYIVIYKNICIQAHKSTLPNIIYNKRMLPQTNTIGHRKDSSLSKQRFMELPSE